MDQRAADRIGEIHEVLIEEPSDDLADEQGGPTGGSGGWRYLGHAAHQAPEVDGATQVHSDRPLAIGDLVRVRVSGSEGVDLMAEFMDTLRQAGAARIAGEH